VTAPRPRPSRKGVVFAALTTACFVGWIVVSAADVQPVPGSYGTDAFSRTAVGHAALVAFLRAAGFPAIVSRYRSGAVAGERGLLVLAEPRIGARARSGPGPRLDEEDDDVSALVGRARRVLVVLPKRRPAPAGAPKPYELVPREEVEAVLQAFVPGAALLRLHVDAPLSGATFRAPDGLQLADPGPDFVAVRSAAGRALVLRGDDGEGRDVWILTDPDLVATHGLAKPGVPTFAAELFRDALDGSDGAVVVDEAHHGFELRPSFFARFGRPPLSYLLFHAGVLFALAWWAGAVRFGPAARPAAPPADGRAGLVELTADLLVSARGGAAGATARHAEHRLRDAAARLRIDPGLPPNELVPRVDAATAGRAAPGGFAAVDAAVAAARRASPRTENAAVADAARALHQWRESLHGSRGSPFAR
jgi:hypothetical protein